MTESTIEPRANLDLARRLDFQGFIATALNGGADVAVLERLFAVHKEYRAELAREAFYAAKAAFFRDCPALKKLSQADIPTKSGGRYTYTYSELGDIMTVVTPILGKHGLSVSWKAPRLEPDKVVCHCILSHELGHSETSGDIALPVETAFADRGANQAQRVGSALTYAERYSTQMVLGVIPVDDDDARRAGGDRDEDPREEAPRDRYAPPANGSSGAPISEAQGKRFYAIARGSGWSDDEIRVLLNDWSHEHSTEILRSEYDEIINVLKKGPRR
jgi:hypothetical protein